MSTRIRPHSDTLFWAFVVAFATIYLALYPRTYAIEDEFNILSLAVAISRGTVLLDEAGLDLDADLLWNGHRISKFSPFHAALITPAVATNWRLSFAVTAAFVIAGAFVVRGMLRREGLRSEWVALYFLCPGVWFYSRTLMAAVPASVMMLVGTSFLLRARSRPAAAGAALGLAGLLHPWMIGVSAALTTGWWLDAPRDRLRGLAILLVAATPAAMLLLLYNQFTTGSPFVNVYSLVGTQYGFKGENIGTFLPLYLVSLAVMPVAGWAAFSPRWSGGFAVPIAVATVIVMASLYYYRDGLGHGLAGLLPGQRFLLPASILACVPAARLLSSRFAGIQTVALPRAAFVGFVLGFFAVSFWHGAYLDAHHGVQAAIKTSIPEGSRVLVGDRAFKEFAPVLGTWQVRQIREGLPDYPDRDGSYSVWIGAPGASPPDGWFSDPSPRRIPARSWIWSRDVWIGAPSRSSNQP